MEHITSRKNKVITHLRKLGQQRSYRCEAGVFLCDGEKLLREALASKAEIEFLLWSEKPAFSLPDPDIKEFTAPTDLVQYVSPLKDSAGPVFSVKIPGALPKWPIKNAIVLENVQDPGNVGAILRTARAFDIGCVLLTGGCADAYNPKAVRGSMGAVFTQRVEEIALDSLPALLAANHLELYGAALSAQARDVRKIRLKNAAVAIGSEGKGLSEKLLAMCRSRLIIPMAPESESLNAANAASIIMWEMYR